MTTTTTTPFTPGDSVTWQYVPRGGYGYGYGVPGVFVGYAGQTRARIAVHLADGTPVQRVVSTRNLRRRGA